MAAADFIVLNYICFRFYHQILFLIIGSALTIALLF